MKWPPSGYYQFHNMSRAVVPDGIGLDVSHLGFVAHDCVALFWLTAAGCVVRVAADCAGGGGRGGGSAGVDSPVESATVSNRRMGGDAVLAGRPKAAPAAD